MYIDTTVKITKVSRKLSYSPATNQQICSQTLKENILIWKYQFRKVHIIDLFQTKFMINKKKLEIIVY